MTSSRNLTLVYLDISVNVLFYGSSEPELQRTARQPRQLFDRGKPGQRHPRTQWGNQHSGTHELGGEEEEIRGSEGRTDDRASGHWTPHTHFLLLAVTISIRRHACIRLRNFADLFGEFCVLRWIVPLMQAKMVQSQFK